jgi:hypothetical protein
MRRRIICVALLLFTLGMFAPVASAQVPQYPPVPLSVCIRLIIGLANGHPVLFAREHIVLFGPPGCGLLGEDVTLLLHSTPVVLGKTKVAEDGSFRVEGVVPADFPVGNHQLVVGLGKQQIVRPVQMQAVGVPAVSKLPSTNTRDVGMLVMWMVLLLGGVSAVVLFGLRRRGVRASSGSAAIDVGIQRVDTSRFTPIRHRGERPPPPSE